MTVSKTLALWARDRGGDQFLTIGAGEYRRVFTEIVVAAFELGGPEILEDGGTVHAIWSALINGNVYVRYLASVTSTEGIRQRQIVHAAILEVERLKERHRLRNAVMTIGRKALKSR